MLIRSPQNRAGLWKTLTLIALLLTASAALAQQEVAYQNNPLKKLSLEELTQVEVVTQSKQPSQLLESATAVYVLTAEDIRRSGVTNIPDALRLVPGVHVARVNGSRNWAVGIRGFGDQFSKGVLVLIDGRTIYQPLFGGVHWTINNVPIEDVERIEVIRGPGGTIWGTNAVNGVINIITRKAADTRGGLLALGGGNIDQGTITARYGGGNGKGFDYRVYGMGFIRGHEHHVAKPEYDDSRLGQLGFRADWSRSADTFTLQGDIYNGEFGDAQRLSTYDPPVSFISYRDMDGRGGNLSFAWQRALNQTSNLQFQAFYAHDFRTGSNFGETRHTIDVDFLHRLSSWGRHQFTYGAGARLSPGEFEQVVETINFLPHRETSEIYSFFLQDEIAAIRNRLTLTVGTKVEHNNYTGVEFQPSIRMLLKPTQKQTVWAAVTRAVRIPSRLESDIHVTQFAFDAPPPVFARIVGSRDLRAERVVAYEAGFRSLLHKRFLWGIHGFVNRHEDIIGIGNPVTFPETEPAPPHLVFQFPFTNAIRGTSKGIETSAFWQATDDWVLRGDYTYLDLNLENRPSITTQLTLNQYRNSSPQHMVNLQSRFDLPAHFEFDQIYRYVGELTGQSVPAYHALDLRVGWSWRDTEISIVGQNLLDPHHPEFGVDPPPTVEIQRRVYGKIVWRIE